MNWRLGFVLGCGVISFALSADAKTCSGASCAVPGDCDCSTYMEAVITDPTSGSEVTHTGEFLFLFSADNCHKENSNLKGTLNHTVTWTKTVTLSITAGTGVSASVKGEIGVPLLANAEATAGISSHLDATVSGSVSQTTTDSATWQYDVPACIWKGANLLGDWKTSAWTKTRYVKGYYYKSGDLNGPFQTVTCMNASGSSEGTSKYYTWGVSALADRNCSSCP